MPIKLAHHNAVILKGHGDRIGISLDPSMPFAELKKHFKKRVIETKQFFEGAKSNISFTGRDLTEAEEKALLNIILKETGLDIPFVGNEVLFVSNTNTQDKLNEEVITALPDNVHPTIYHRGVLRSGQCIRYNGSVVVLGDVNPGGEIIADGNIIVLGALKGMAHAGFSGDESCFVSGTVFWPTQLRIAGMMTYIPDDKRPKLPAYAYIKEGQLFVAMLT